MTENATRGLVMVCAEDEIADGEAVVVPAETTGWSDDIAVFLSDGAFHALDDTCSHEQASLAEGWIEGCEVECPLHQSRFSLSTGEALCLPATNPVRVHHVEVHDGAVWLSLGTAPAGK